MAECDSGEVMSFREFNNEGPGTFGWDFVICSNIIAFHLYFQSTGGNGALESAMVLRIIEILKKEPDISQEDLADRLGTTRRIIQKHINVLKEAGRIERVGGKRYGHWEIRD